MDYTRIELDTDVKEECANILNDCLANTLYAVLSSKFAHWNVKGTGFYPAHLLFDKIYEFYSDSADTLAERITALGGIARGELIDVSSTSEISYDANANSTVKEHMQAMADMLGQVSNAYRQGIEATSADKATQDVLIELTRSADKFLYFLEADLRAS
jgi:starvation-inducible DNA-binding protein